MGIEQTSYGMRLPVRYVNMAIDNNYGATDLGEKGS